MDKLKEFWSKVTSSFLIISEPIPDDFVEEFSSLNASSFSIIQAIERLNLWDSTKNIFKIHILGCTLRRECQSPQKTFFYFNKLLLYFLSKKSENLILKLVCCGPELQGFPDLYQEGTHCHQQFPNCHISFSCQFYHDYIINVIKNSDENSPDLVYAPNAGLWVFESWKDTILLWKDKLLRCPLLVTAFSEKESRWEEEILLKHYKLDKIWGSEINPCGSLIARNIKMQDFSSNSSVLDEFPSRSESWWICCRSPQT